MRQILHGALMGTISKRPGTRGPRYRGEIRIKRDGKLVHREARTFKTKALAQTWIDKREAVLGERTSFERYTIGDAIDEYEQRYEDIHAWGRTKRTTLDFLRRRIGEWDAVELTSGMLVRHVSERRAEASAATVSNDLTWLAVVFKAMRALGRPVALTAVEDAILICRQQGLTGRPGRRERRPTAAELALLDAYFISRHSDIPMSDLMWFAVHSSRRQAEITRLEWADNDEATLTGMVRDLKHPRKKVGNHRRFKYTQAAWDIVQRQDKDSPFIFPYDPKTVGTLFTRACKVLEIEDLRFHDLRHEATSRLFEAGYSIVEVQQFTLHEDWKILARYTNLRPEGVTLR